MTGIMKSKPLAAGASFEADEPVQTKLIDYLTVEVSPRPPL